MTLYEDLYIQIIFLDILLCKEDVKRNFQYAINLNQSNDRQNHTGYTFSVSVDKRL